MVIAVSAAIGVAVTAAGAIGQWFVLNFRASQNASEIAEHREALAQMRDEHSKFREMVVSNYVQRPELKTLGDDIKTYMREMELRLERTIQNAITKVRT